ncbi:unnamed protein product [Effrenium voratum]|nr:unnamed protein product [Effrenium voratum]
MCYLAADHEGKNGAARLVSQVPALPLALSWEGKDHIFGMSIAAWPGCENLPRLYLQFGLVDMATIGQITIPLKG